MERGRVKRMNDQKLKAGRSQRAVPGSRAQETTVMTREFLKGRMKGDSNSEDEKMRAENGRIKGDLKERTKQFALNIIALYSQLPKRREAQVLGDQLLRSGTSVGAHFWEAQRAKSNPDFISKIEGGMQELEETAYWLELLEGARCAGEINWSL